MSVDFEGNYSSIGESNHRNWPRARAGAASALNDDGSVLMIMGGDFNHTRSLNDWMSYDVGSQVWTWVSGGLDSNSTPAYNGAVGSGSRRYHNMVFEEGRWFIFGGGGYLDSTIRFQNQL